MIRRDDLIRRSDAIKSLNDYLGDCYRVSRRKYEKTMLDAISMDFEAVITNVPAVEPKQEWIPCSERLPHAECGESDNVLVTCESTLIRLLYFNGGNWCYPTGECYEHRIDKVVAWMPLPEPWEGAGDD